MKTQFGHYARHFFRHPELDSGSPKTLKRVQGDGMGCLRRRICFGRSMIEMLGVLAIIGVISIGGISMYRRAIDTHKANSIFDDVNRFEFVISERVERTPRGFFDKADFKPISGFEMSAYNEPELASHHISVADVPKSVCRIVLDKGEKDYVMFANNLMFDGDSSICSQDLNEMRFYFGDTSDLCSFPTEGQDSCSDGCLCDGDNECKPDIYNPDSIPKMTEETVCCPKDSNIVACNGKCIDNNCGTGKTLDRKTCQCVCDDPMKMIDGSGNCVCKPDTSGIELSEDENGNCQCPSSKPYYFDEASGGPACCAAGYTPVDGICHRLSCDGGTCKLDGVTCGIGCSTVTDENGNIQAGRNCEAGVCRADECQKRTPPLEMASIPWKASSSDFSYFCLLGEDNKKACGYTRNTTSSSFYNKNFCFLKEKKLSNYCGYADTSLNMTSGLCDADYCTQHFKTFDANVYYDSFVGNTAGCYFPNHNDMQCTPANYVNGQPDKWNCYIGSSKALCHGCSTPQSCATSCDICNGDGYTVIHNGTTYCCDSAENPILCKQGGSFYFTSDWDHRCGQTCSWTTGLCTTIGTCTMSNSIPDCRVKDKNGNIISCSNGYSCKYDAKKSVAYGCVNDTKGITCYHYWGEGEIHCVEKSTGKGCGHDCDLGGHCNTPYMPECAYTDAVTGKPYCVITSSGYDMGTDQNNPTCLCKYGDGTAASVSSYNGHYYCCPTGHTYVNGACSAN